MILKLTIKLARTQISNSEKHIWNFIANLLFRVEFHGVVCTRSRDEELCVEKKLDRWAHLEILNRGKRYGKVGLAHL